MRCGDLAVVLLLGVLQGCASTPAVRHFAYAADQSTRVWPAPESGEVARYGFVGHLYGESNFHAEQRERPPLARALRWLAGIDARARQPMDLLRPHCVTSDPDGTRVLITDSGRQAVFVFDLAANRFEVWGQGGRPLPLAEPIGIGLNAQGDALIADAARRVVLRIDRGGRLQSEIGAGRFERPTGVAVDRDTGLLFVADTPAHRIQVFDADGRWLRSFGLRGEKPGELNFPTHLAWGGGRLWVTDAGNARVQAFDADGRVQGGVGRPGLYVGQLARPKGVAFDSEGHVLVIESLYAHLLAFDTTGQFLLGIGGEGSGIGEFRLPGGVWADGQGFVYVADMYNARVTVLRRLAEPPT